MNKKDYQEPTYEIVEWDELDIITGSPSYGDGPGFNMGDSEEWDWDWN